MKSFSTDNWNPDFPNARVAVGAKLGHNVDVGFGTVIYGDVVIGAGTRIWAFAHIVSGAVVGTDCNLCDRTFVEGKVVLGVDVASEPTPRPSLASRSANGQW